MQHTSTPAGVAADLSEAMRTIKAYLAEHLPPATTAATPSRGDSVSFLPSSSQQQPLYLTQELPLQPMIPNPGLGTVNNPASPGALMLGGFGGAAAAAASGLVLQAAEPDAGQGLFSYAAASAEQLALGDTQWHASGSCWRDAAAPFAAQQSSQLPPVGGDGGHSLSVGLPHSSSAARNGRSRRKQQPKAAAAGRRRKSTFGDSLRRKKVARTLQHQHQQQGPSLLDTHTTDVSADSVPGSAAAAAAAAAPAGGAAERFEAALAALTGGLVPAREPMLLLLPTDPHTQGMQLQEAAEATNSFMGPPGLPGPADTALRSSEPFAQQYQIAEPLQQQEQPGMACDAEWLEEAGALAPLALPQQQCGPRQLDGSAGDHSCFIDDTDAAADSHMAGACMDLDEAAASWPLGLEPGSDQTAAAPAALPAQAALPAPPIHNDLWAEVLRLVQHGGGQTAAGLQPVRPAGAVEPLPWAAAAEGVNSLDLTVSTSRDDTLGMLSGGQQGLTGSWGHDSSAPPASAAPCAEYMHSLHGAVAAAAGLPPTASLSEGTRDGGGTSSLCIPAAELERLHSSVSAATAGRLLNLMQGAAADSSKGNDWLGVQVGLWFKELRTTAADGGAQDVFAITTFLLSLPGFKAWADEVLPAVRKEWLAMRLREAGFGGLDASVAEEAGQPGSQSKEEWLAMRVVLDLS